LLAAASDVLQDAGNDLLGLVTPLAASCSSQLVTLGMLRYCLDLLDDSWHQAGSQPEHSQLARNVSSCLYYMTAYGAPLLCKR